LGCEIGKVSNPFIKTSFNGLYLKDIIKQHGEEVSVSVPELNSEGFVSKCCRFGDDNYFTIVMPLN
jgi:DNA polymerase III sliding clamp (beta) subunit (PCNA family)